jgi:cAMP-specific phosphodiesterase
MSLTALLEQQRRDIERTRLTSTQGARVKPVLFPRDYLASRNGGSRPPRSVSALDSYSTSKETLPDTRRSASSMGGAPPEQKHSHLHEALQLTLNILRRHQREHLSISPEDAVMLAQVAGFHTDMSMSPAESPKVPTTESIDREAPPRLGGRRSSRDLLSKIRGIVHNPQMYRDMVSSKASMKSLTQFAIECTSKTANITALYQCVLDQLLACMHDDGELEECVLDLLVLDPRGAHDAHVAFINIAKQEAVVVAASDALCRTGPVTFEGDVALMPITVDGELYGVVQFRGVSETTFTEKRSQLLNAVSGIAGLSLRTASQFDRLEHQRSKNAEMLEMVRSIASTRHTESQIIETIMESAKKLINAAHCSFHFVADGRILTTSPGEDDSGEGDSMSMPEGTTATSLEIAASVARSGSTAMVNDLAGSGYFTNAELERLTGIRTQSVLCLPVKDANGAIIGVAQLSNKEPQLFGGVLTPQRFTAIDETLFSTYASFAAISIGNARAKTELEGEKTKSEAVLRVVKYLAECDIRDVNSVVTNVMHGAKDLLHADRASLFLIDEERHELYSKVADSTGGKEIRFPIGKGIAGTVASSGVAEIIDDAYTDDRFNRDFDKQLGYRTRTMLAEPIAFRGDILAVAQLVNKVDPATQRVQRFTRADQETFRTFALFAAISLSNSRLLEFVIRAGEEAMALNETQFDPTKNTLTRRASSMKGVHVTDAERRRVKEVPLAADDIAKITTKEFNLFTYREKADNMSSARDMGCRVVAEIFKATGYLDTFNVDEDTLYNFIIRCRSKYRNVPYHNFFHAVDAVQTIFTYLFVGRAKEKLTDLEGFVLLIAALCHDLDHMGLNNNFHLKTDSPLGILSSASGNKSVLEVHHCNLAVEILQEPTSNMFESLDHEQAATAYRILIDAILATDMARHGDLLNSYSEVISEGYDTTNKDHRTLLTQMLLKAADISNVTKPFEVSRMWAISVTEEFYQQGDREKEQGVEVNPMFDRTQGGELAKGQLGFINFIAKRFFTMITAESAVSGMKWCMNNLEQNTATWQSMLSA